MARSTLRRTDSPALGQGRDAQPHPMVAASSSPTGTIDLMKRPALGGPLKRTPERGQLFFATTVDPSVFDGDVVVLLACFTCFTVVALATTGVVALLVTCACVALSTGVDDAIAAACSCIPPQSATAIAGAKANSASVVPIRVFFMDHLL